jgi:hypothetical protein
VLYAKQPTPHQVSFLLTDNSNGAGLAAADIINGEGEYPIRTEGLLLQSTLGCTAPSGMEDSQLDPKELRKPC